MKARYRPNERLEFEIEGTQQKEIFGQLAQLDEVFGEAQCGHCESQDIFFRVRNVTKKNKTYTYHEMVCRECGHHLEYGQHQQGGTLFPKRKVEDSDGSLVYDKKSRGWRKWAGPVDEDEDEDEE